MKDFFTFKRMLTPVLIQVGMVIAMLVLVLTGLYGIFYQHDTLRGVIIIVLGPISMRLIAEFLVVFFRLNETMTDIYNTLQKIETTNQQPKNITKNFDEILL